MTTNSQSAERRIILHAVDDLSCAWEDTPLLAEEVRAAAEQIGLPSGTPEEALEALQEAAEDAGGRWEWVWCSNARERAVVRYVHEGREEA